MNTLNRLETVLGDYGLYIKIKYTDEIDTNASNEKTFNFSQDDMYGDVYNFTTYFAQEAVFDISDIGIIKSIEVYLYQGSNFKRVKSTADSKDNLELIPNKITYTDIDGKPYTTEMESNIFVDNIQVSLGYDLNNFENDTVIVYTLNSTQYSSSDNSASRKREIRARWVHKTDDGFVSVPTTDLTKYNAGIHWYHYVLDEKANKDDFGGKYWVPIKSTDKSKEQYLDANDDYKCYIVCDPAVQDENVKAVISIPSAEKLAYIEELKDYFKNDRDLSTEDDVSLIVDALEKYDVINGDNNVLDALTNLRDKVKNEDLNKAIDKINEMKANLSPYDLYSDVVQIHNTTQVQARLAVDLVQAVSIAVGDENDPYKGVYMVYGENGDIMNSSLSVQRQKLILSYGSLLTGLKEFDGDGSEIVSWRFPLTNTMIRPPVDGVEYDSTKGFKDGDGQPVSAIQYVDDDGNNATVENATWAVIRRQIYGEKTAEGKIAIGGFKTKTTEQVFRIKDYYTSVGRNTIYCEISKGGYIYVAEITLIFGTAGTSGTDYTLRIIPSANGLTSGGSIKLDAQVYDYNNQKVAITGVNWSFISPNSLNKTVGEKVETLPISFNENGVLNSSKGTSTTIYWRTDAGTANYYCIVKANATISALGNTVLTAYFPLSWSSDLTKYNHFEGPDKIVYNAQGTNPFYYKNNFVLYNNLDKPVSGLVWSIEVYNSDISVVSKFYPQVLESGGLYSLKVPSMYIKENFLCRLVGKVNNDIVWIQPLYISQNAYNSPLLNSWNGELSIDKDQGTILAPMIGAGKKNTNNQFSGVLMGDVKKADETISLTGLYGYQNGIQTFALTEDGKASLGVSGKGQIIIDGTSGTIQSGNYKTDNKEGMKIDLEDGQIDAYNFRLTSKYITISSQENEKNYFTIRGSGTYTSKTYTYNSTTQQLSNIAITPTTITNTTLINVGNNSYYLQTLNYSTSNEEGMRWDLQTGQLNAYTGFNLTAVNHTVKVKGVNDDVADDSKANVETKDGSIYYRGILSINADAGQFPIKLQLGADTPFKLSWAGYLHTTKLQATGGTIGGWYIQSNMLTSDSVKEGADDPNVAIVKSGTLTNISCPNNKGQRKTTTTINTFTGPYIRVGGLSGSTQVVSVDTLPEGAKLAEHKEGEFTDTDIGKYIKKSDGKYYKIIRTTNNPSYYELQFQGSGGIYLLGGADSKVIMKNLYLEGGGGYWGGYAEYTSSYGHTHNLSGKIPKKIFRDTNLRSIEAKGTDSIILCPLKNSQIAVNGSYTGNSNDGLTFDLQLDYDADQGLRDTYYPKSAYDAVVATKDAATEKYWTDFTVQKSWFGLFNSTLTIYAYRINEKTLRISRTQPSGTKV